MKGSYTVQTQRGRQEETFVHDSVARANWSRSRHEFLVVRRRDEQDFPSFFSSRGQFDYSIVLGAAKGTSSMTTLIWQSWRNVSTAEAGRILQFFSSHGPVVGFRSTRKTLYGSAGQGLVVFRDRQSAAKLLTGDEGTGSADLRHLFEPQDTTRAADSGPASSKTNVGTSTSKESKASRYQISFRDIDKEPAEIHLETQLERRLVARSKERGGHMLSRERAVCREFYSQVLEALPAYTPAAGTLVKEAIDEVFANFVATKKKRTEAGREKGLERYNDDTAVEAIEQDSPRVDEKLGERSPGALDS